MSAAARAIHAGGANDMEGFLKASGGVTGCADLWAKRGKKSAATKPGRIAPPEGARA